MGRRLDKLLSIAGPALGEQGDQESFGTEGRIGEELNGLLRRVNGFYAFESALHVFPSALATRAVDLQTWNSRKLWRNAYGDYTEGYLFFAEDAFGGQFAVKSETIWVRLLWR